MSYCAAHPAKLSDFISGCCYTVIKICQQMATLQQKDFFLSSSAPTPTTDSQLYCDFAGGCPPSPLYFLWSRLWMYFFLLRVVFLSLPRMRAKPLVSCSSDETSWGSICSDPTCLPSAWLTIVVSSCCVFLDASSNFICSSRGAPCIIWPAHFLKFFFNTQTISKAPRTLRSSCSALAWAQVSSSICPVLPRPWPQICPRVGLQRECQGVVLIRGKRVRVSSWAPFVMPNECWNSTGEDRQERGRSHKEESKKEEGRGIQAKRSRMVGK